MTPQRKAWLVAGVGVALLILLIGAAKLSDMRTGANVSEQLPITPELIERGAYLAKLGDCAACHSVPGSPAFAGGLRMNLPIGAIYTTNITPDKRYGIGNYTLVDFDRALRFGVARGHTLYPAMPFASYANTRPEDIEALYAYFQRGVVPAPIPSKAADIRFPLSMRWPLTYWRWIFAPRPTPFAIEQVADPIVARGEYIVEGLGHCGECHTPRAFTLQVKAQNARQGDLFLSGALVENWYAPSLRNGGLDTIGAWSAEEIASFLTTGANDHGIAFGSMNDVIVHSSQYMTPEDASATAAFLKRLAPAGSVAAKQFAYDESTDRALRRGDAEKRGALLYLDNCAACHRPDGQGYNRVFPALAGNPVVEAADPISLASIVLAGSATPITNSTPAQFTMPAFDWRLTDQEVTDVVNFVRTSWGNSAGAIDLNSVSHLRRGLQLSQR
jgi:alcohol dehydrogenase (quinone), cytochrome c subunit